MVHLNITLDEDLYRQLKAKAPAKKLSAFIAQALRKQLGPDRAELEQAYRDAAKEAWRPTLSNDWSSTEVEAWPK
jgi:Post-segregation antitoxin CcdA